MKKITLILTATLMLHVVHAQVEKGSIFTGGSFGINSNKTENSSNDGKSSNFNWSVSPQIGKVFETNKVIGIQLLLGGSTNKTNIPQANESKNTSSVYGASIFYRQYFTMYKKWMFYGQGNAGVNFSNNDYVDQGVKRNKGNGVNAGLNGSLGITFQASRKLWLEAGLNDFFGLNYSHSKSDAFSQSGQVTSSAKSNGVTANFNISGANSLAVGFRWIFPKN